MGLMGSKITLEMDRSVSLPIDVTISLNLLASISAKFLVFSIFKLDNSLSCTYSNLLNSSSLKISPPSILSFLATYIFEYSTWDKEVIILAYEIISKIYFFFRNMNRWI